MIGRRTNHLTGWQGKVQLPGDTKLSTDLSQNHMPFNYPIKKFANSTNIRKRIYDAVFTNVITCINWYIDFDAYILNDI